MAHADTCFHCALPIPDSCQLVVTFDDGDKPVCCPGCKAVAELILTSGMASYYRVRETPDPGTGKPREDEQDWQVFSSDDMVNAFAQNHEGQWEANIYVGGMYCSACSWLVETTLGGLPGIRSAAVNPVTHRLRVAWTANTSGLGDILGKLAELGYEPQPLRPNESASPETAEQRIALKRLLVASLGMMQVMMFAVGLYAGDYQGIDDDMRRFFRLVSFVVTTLVVFYAARPFFASAVRGIVARAPGMDLPVSIAIGAAYIASGYATFTNGDAVWFDSVAMFVFFLTLGRFLEMRARHRAVDHSTALSQAMPNTTTLLVDGQTSVVPVSRLSQGDVVMIRGGESVPADGTIVNGATHVDEALLTGESAAQQRGCGDRLTAGTINLDGAVSMRVEKTGSDTVLSAISRLSERAHHARPTVVRTADRIAGYFVVVLLVVAIAVATGWSLLDPDRAFVITLSVLVVTCPCALSLATPAAFAAASSRLAQRQLLVTNGDAIEVLSRATHFVFDKTGTLTGGSPAIMSVAIFDDGLDRDSCLQIAAALEQPSTHPLANAFGSGLDLAPVSNAVVHIGRGVSGTIAGHNWRLGSASFACETASETTLPVDNGITVVYLANAGHCVARFDIEDQPRPDAGETVQMLRELGLRLSIASGDQEPAVAKIAASLGISTYDHNCSPAGKLAIIEALQQDGETVVMVGDGINDAPVLAGADTSIAPAHGALLAQTRADVIMIGDSLQPLVTAVSIARRTQQIVRQNLIWAIAYNATALPLAIAGWVPPWLAAIGMSMSSLVVVLNALRLNRA